VLGAFTGGGSNLGNLGINQDHYELQNYTSLSTGKHLTKFGGRLRVAAETDNSTPNFNGTFIFPSLTAFKITEQGMQQGLSPAQIRDAGGGAEQFSINTGRPTINDTLIDAGVFVQDNWRLRSNVTLGYGLRYEMQNGIGGRGDLAPRLGLAWGIHPSEKRSPRNVLRLGLGLFYTRFAQNLVLKAEQLNGTNQRQFIVQNPDFFPNPPPADVLVNSLATPTAYKIDPNLRAPFMVQTSLSFERQLPRGSKLSVTYLDSQGFRQLLSNNINAPLPGTFDISKPGSGVRPFSGQGNIYRYESRGRFDQNQLIINFTVNGLNKIQLNGGYTLGYAASNTGGAASFPSNPFDLNEDYGRASFDFRHRLNLGGRMELPLGLILNGLLIARSGQPFDIILGQDLNGDSIFNDRPSFATSLSSPKNVVKTRFGVFDTAPRAGQPAIPINLGMGPVNFVLNLRLMKAFAIGNTEISSGGGGGRATGAGKPASIYRNAWKPLYTIRFEAFANNVLNHANLGIPIGSLNSPLFGTSIGLAGSPYSQTSATRQIVLRTVFSF
jgi:hypothetical protein